LATFGSLRRACARFDSFQVDLSSSELFRSGVRVPIQEQPLQVLRLLLQAEGKVVTRDEVRAALWPEDTFVDFEHGVNTAVKKLRQALEDSAEHPKFVETLPKIGYRFIAPVDWESDTRGRSTSSVVSIAAPRPTLVPQLAPAERGWKLKAAITLAFLAVIAATVLLSYENSVLSRTRVGRWFRQAVTRQHPEARVALSQRRLTANPDDTPLTGGVISPDGKYLAYTDSSGFYVRQVDGGETHAVPLPKDFEPLPESWFPDSSHLVVSWFGYQRNVPGSATPKGSPPSLWKISILGGTPRKLVDEGSSARVSPDGSKIAFLTGAWDNEQIWLSNEDGSGARKIVDGGQESFGAVAWAPDGKRFATVRSTRTGKQIEVYDIADGRHEVISSDPRLGDAVAWTNTDRLIYSQGEAEPNQGDANLWSLTLEPRSARPLAPATRVTNDRAHIFGISVAVDGKRLALRRNTYQADVYLTEVEARGKRLSPPRRFTLDDRADWPSAWTPDSKSVLFFSDRDGAAHIFKQHVDETQPELLVGGNDVRWVPRLTPDGLSLLYMASAAADQPPDSGRLMRVPLSGGPSQFVLEGAGITSYQCARLPSTLCVYGQMEPNSEFYKFFTFDPAGRKGTEISAARMKREDADGPNCWGISPDGKYLVTSRSQNPYKYPVPAVRMFNLAAGTSRVIPVPAAGLIMGMDWAADSKSVWVSAYRGRGAWGTRSGVLNLDLTGKTSVVYEGLNLGLWFAVPSPDGRRLALLEHTESSNVWLLENF
jgi:Tol biopolymer transport system component/DNA-binding winged helix-turn-helix (wHTH) protein